jgi:hypothetical protein
MSDRALLRAVFWLGIAGLLWLVVRAIVEPLRIAT